MNPASIDIKDYLLTLPLGLVYGTSLFVGVEPDNEITQENITTIFDTPGGGVDLVLGGSAGYYRPSIQIRVRNVDYATGWALINDIKVALHGLNGETINGTLYTLFNCIIEPSLLKIDEKERYKFVTTFNIQRI